jgi:regulator of sigma E protease
VSYAIAILGLLFLVLMHELGHFSAAKAVGMRALHFSLGFPPAIARKQIGDTEYRIGAIPLGGYVKIPGMLRPEPDDLYAVDDLLDRSEELPTDRAGAIGVAVDDARRSLSRGRWDDARADLARLRTTVEDASDSVSAAERRRVDRSIRRVEEALDPRSYWRSTRVRRLIVITAGPAMNVLTCFVILTGVAILGRPEATVVNRVQSIELGSPAIKAGLKPGDRLVSVDGVRGDVSRMRRVIEASNGGTVRLVVERNGHTVALRPVHTRLEDGAYRLGFVFDASITTRGHPVTAAPAMAWHDMARLTTGTLGAIADVVTPQGRSQLHSAVGIVSVSAQEVHYGAGYYLTLLAYVSLSLAIFNLLPFLPLDGGHVLMIALERLRGRMVSRAVFERVSVVGIAVMLIVFVIGLQNDLGQLITTR